MAKDSALLSEIHQLIGRKALDGNSSQPNEIVEEMFRSRPLEGPHAAFYRSFAKKSLVDIVASILRRVGAIDDTSSSQMTLPGHTRLVKSYPVIRNGERSLVPIGLCTPRELYDHVALLRKQARGCESHAAELEEYLAAQAVVEEI